MFSNLLLDMDGTIINSSPGIYKSFCLACDSLLLPCPAFNEFSPLIGPPIQKIALHFYPNINQVQLEMFRKIFRADYDTKSFLIAEWYPDVCDTIKYLKDRDINMTIVTNKPTKPAIKLVEEGGFLSCIDRIIGIDYPAFRFSTPVFKSKAESLAYVFNSAHYCLEESIYLGDTPSDQEACNQCGLSFVAALYGFHKWISLSRPQLYIGKFTEIRSFFYPDSS